MSAEVRLEREPQYRHPAYRAYTGSQARGRVWRMVGGAWRAEYAEPWSCDLRKFVTRAEARHALEQQA